MSIVIVSLSRVPIFDCNPDEVLNQHGMRALRLVVPRNLYKIIRLHTARFLEQLHNGLLDRLIRVVYMDEDLLDSVWVQAARPWVPYMLEKNFKGLARLDSDTVLCIVKSLQELRVDLMEAVMFHVFAHEHHDLREEHDCGEAKIVAPIVVQRGLQLIDHFRQQDTQLVLFD